MIERSMTHRLNFKKEKKDMAPSGWQNLPKAEVSLPHCLLAPGGVICLWGRVGTLKNKKLGQVANLSKR